MINWLNIKPPYIIYCKNLKFTLILFYDFVGICSRSHQSCYYQLLTKQYYDSDYRKYTYLQCINYFAIQWRYDDPIGASTINYKSIKYSVWNHWIYKWSLYTPIWSIYNNFQISIALIPDHTYECEQSYF